MVGNSKVISGVSTHQAFRRRKDTIMGSRVGAEAYSQTREPKGTIGQAFIPTFHAGLTNSSDAKSFGSEILPATVTRSSEATYRNLQGKLVIADINESRHEYVSGQALGCLMEPPSTNKCANENANPTDISGWTLQGDPAAVFSVVDDSASLGDFSTDLVSGLVFRLDNTAGATPAFVISDGDVGNTNDHAITAYMRGTGDGHLGLNAVTEGPYFSLSASYERKAYVLTPLGSTNSLAVYAGAGAVVYFILHDLQEQPIPNSTIIIEGTAASRAVDQVQWPLGNTLNQAQGMSAILWRPGFANADIGGSGSRPQDIVSLVAANGRFVYFEKDNAGVNLIQNSDGTVVSSVSVLGGILKDTSYLIALRWGSSTKQIGVKQGGTWVWSSVDAYDGGFTQDGAIRLCTFSDVVKNPTHNRDLYFWDEDRGTAWLESFFSGIAN